MKRQDLRNINEQTQVLQKALDEMQELTKVQEEYGADIDNTQYEQAQEKAKDAINKILHYADDVVDRTDLYEGDNGEKEVTLPNGKLPRDKNKEVPSKPSK